MHPEPRPNPGRSLDPLEARLRALPPPPVPAGLEARLLATIPAVRPTPSRRWVVWVGVTAAVAAACVVVVLTWPKRDGGNPNPGPENRESANHVAPRPSDDSDRLAAWRESRRGLDRAEPAPFAWPLQETTPLTGSTAIPSDLLD